MKKPIAIAAAILTSIVAFPQKAEAGYSSVSFTYQSGRSACGCPIYTKRYVAGYDCYRRPIYRYVSVPVVHRCSHESHRSHYIHSNRNHCRPVYRPSCGTSYTRNHYTHPPRSHGSHYYRRSGGCR